MLPSICHNVWPTKQNNLSKKRQKIKKQEMCGTVDAFLLSQSYICHVNRYAAVSEMLPPEQSCRQERPHMGKYILWLLYVLLLFASGVPIWISRDWLFPNNAPCSCMCFKAFIPGAKQANTSSAPACRLSPTINVWHSCWGADQYCAKRPLPIQSLILL